MQLNFSMFIVLIFRLNGLLLRTGDMRKNTRPFIVSIPSPVDQNHSDMIGEY